MTEELRHLKSRVLPRTVTSKNGCWIYCGQPSGRYATTKFHGKHIGVHRLSFIAYKGAIPLGLVIDHLCRQPKCVNPDHMEIVTNKENVLRGIGWTAQNKRATHCVHGHSFSEHGYVCRNWRRCRECDRRISMEYQRKLRTKRGLAGRCPHCNRTFQQVTRHIKSQHSVRDFGLEEER